MVDKLIKIDLSESLLRLEYLCLEYNLPIDLIRDYKLLGFSYLVIGIDPNGKILGTEYIDRHGKSSNEEKLSNIIKSIFDSEHGDELSNTFRKYYLNYINRLEPIKPNPKSNLDDILDKINAYGINSLLKEEFEYLSKYSNN
jgi:hypothetical protein